ncbi:LLM class flavin-dependent oxidoreductase [Pararhizobium sp. YC-54]|uniref:LLM class flavin-dependent oxidoreductase n=1 Tax=Pararhizobium sp. YC-54 TaxID=2986920 RepID=UPI0021F6D475|nr:LLM class flavin-dependent oxidoreductase [Pararhizobium sp. YC-54]MCV9999261.1 LLM class flavin-dependent oxidoreductase [Pararhizobium sp. YC-54]
MPILPDTEFLVAHYMPYTELPAEEADRESLWVDIPNSLYDPKKGHDLYGRYFHEAVLAEKLGFDGICINEHHATASSMMPVPSLIAATIFAQTSKLKVCVMGTPPNMDSPNRLAETYAMLDVMSGGRLEIAIPLGTPMEYWVNPVAPATARKRHREAIDIILKAWTSREATSHDGEFYHYKYLNVWPRPYQDPHPPIFIVGSGSLETVDLAVEYGFGYASTFSPIAKQLQALDYFRKKTTEAGRAVQPNMFPLTVMTYVAETDEQALAEFEEHAKYYFDFLLRPGEFANLPGYIALDELRKRGGHVLPKSHGKFDWDDLQDFYRVAVGSAETVTNKIEKWSEEVGSSRIIFEVHTGDMPHWKLAKNMTLLAEKVVPELKRRRDAAQTPAQAAE